MICDPLMYYPSRVEALPTVTVIEQKLLCDLSFSYFSHGPCDHLILNFFFKYVYSFIILFYLLYILCMYLGILFPYCRHFVRVPLTKFHPERKKLNYRLIVRLQFFFVEKSCQQFDICFHRESLVIQAKVSQSSFISRL